MLWGLSIEQLSITSACPAALDGRGSDLEACQPGSDRASSYLHCGIPRGVNNVFTEWSQARTMQPAVNMLWFGLPGECIPGLAASRGGYKAWESMGDLDYVWTMLFGRRLLTDVLPRG